LTDIAVVILNFCSFDNTKNLVNKLINSNVHLNIIIVDNNSSDNSYEHLISNFNAIKNITIIKNSENNGYASGNNIGIKFAIGEYNPKYITILNPDVILSDNFITNMVSYLQKDADLASITGIMLNWDGGLDLDLIAWKLPSNFDDFFLNSGLIKKLYNPIRYNKFENCSAKLSGIYYVDSIPGSCFIIRSDVLQRINYFDENTFLYCEERILSKKIRDIGLKVGLSINDNYIHNHKYYGKDLRSRFKDVYLLYKSRIYYDIKYNSFGVMNVFFIPIIALTIPIGFLEQLILGLKQK